MYNANNYVHVVDWSVAAVAGGSLFFSVVCFLLLSLSSNVSHLFSVFKCFSFFFFFGKLGRISHVTKRLPELLAKAVGVNIVIESFYSFNYWLMVLIFFILNFMFMFNFIYGVNCLKRN